MIILYTFLILGGLGLLLGFGLAIADKIFYVKVDNRIEEVSKMLPNYNCGACGFAGCNGFAEALVKHENTDLTRCKPGKVDTNYKPIQEYLNNNPDEDGTDFKLKF